ncbi:MAG TPA: glutamate synthase-related protein, partial [Candidatus Acidoferrum sp.]|nr:glutamate synthase-related protein [Candidatus Acidoferrum sp.]
VFSAMAAAAREANTLMIVPAGLWTGELLSFSRHLIPMLPDGSPGGLGKALDGVRMVEIPLQRDVSCRIQALKERRPDLVVSVRVPVTPAAKREAEALTHSGVEVIHFVAEGDGREYDASSPRFIKDVIREVHLSLVAQGLRDRVTLIFGGGIALAEHVGKAVICGADAVSLERPLLIALECRLCGQCAQGRFCPVELENIQPRWGRQRIVNLMAAWHGQLLEVLGAMGLRDLRRMRGEAGRAIFREEIEKDTFGRLFGPPVMRDDREGEGGSHVLAT